MPQDGRSQAGWGVGMDGKRRFEGVYLFVGFLQIRNICGFVTISKKPHVVLCRSLRYVQIRLNPRNEVAMPDIFFLKGQERKKGKAFEIWMACKTQEEIAEAVEVSQDTVSEWSKGFTENLGTEESVKWTGFEIPIYNVWKQETVANWQDDFRKNSEAEDFLKSRRHRSGLGN